MLAAYLTHPDCARHEMGPDHPECPQRLDAIQDHLVAKGLMDFMVPYEAPLATHEELQRAHSALLVREIIAKAPSEGLVHIDPDTAMNPYTLQAALRAAGAAIEATDLVIAGQVSTAFCAVRPPGHHAERSSAMGFCFFNNVAVGIKHALEYHGLERVALLDFDVHHGNGSEDILHDDPRVLMCSTYEQGLYPFSGETPRGPNIINVGLPPRAGSQAFRQAVTDHWLPALEAFQPQMLYISAGFDGHREDDMGNLALVEADYEWVTRQLMQVARRHAQGRVVSCLEGGYALSALGRSVAAHVRALIEA